MAQLYEFKFYSQYFNDIHYDCYTTINEFINEEVTMIIMQINCSFYKCINLCVNILFY